MIFMLIFLVLFLWIGYRVLSTALMHAKYSDDYYFSLENDPELLSVKKKISSKSRSKSSIQNILVTGGCGAMGRAIVNHLLEWNNNSDNKKDIRIIVFDVVTPDHEHEHGDRLHYVRGNITDRNDVASVLEQYRIDTIVHTAAVVSLRNHWPSIYRVNVVGTFMLLKSAAQSHHVGSLVLIGSSSAYMNPIRSTSKSDDLVSVFKNCTTRNCQTYYGFSKSIAEHLVKQAHDMGLLNTCVLMPHVVEGPGTINTRVLFADHGRVVMLGDGRATFSPLHTYNAGRAVKQALIRVNEGNPQVCGRSIFISDGINGSKEGLAREYWRIYSRESNVPVPPFQEIPLWLQTIMASSIEFVDWMTNFTLPNKPLLQLSRGTVLYSSVSTVIDNSDAEHRLGYSPIPFEECAERCVKELVANK